MSIDNMDGDYYGTPYDAFFEEMLDDAQKEEFISRAYSYRSWPVTDQEGVCARYEELKAFLGRLIEECR